MAEPSGVPAAAPCIREMREGDLDEVLRIERASYLSPWSRAAFLSEILAQEPSVSLVADMPGAGPGGGPWIAGYLCFWVLEGEMQVNNVAVHPSWRRRGVGETLMRRALEIGRRRGAAHCFLDVRPSNRGAIRLYRKLGFLPKGFRRHYYQDTGEDAIVMRLDFPTGGGRAGSPGRRGPARP